MSEGVRDLRPIKSGIAALYEPAHPLRAFISVQPDELPESAFKTHILPTILALGRARSGT